MMNRVRICQGIPRGLSGGVSRLLDGGRPRDAVRRSSMVMRGRITLGGGVALDDGTQFRKRSQKVRFAGRGFYGWHCLEL